MLLFTKIDEGLIHLINIYGVTELVIGAAADRHYRRSLSVNKYYIQTEIDLIFKDMFYLCVVQENESTTVSDSTECDAKS